MNQSTLRYSLLIGTLLGLAALSHAQQPADAAKAPPTTPTAPTTNSTTTTTITTTTTTAATQTPSASDLPSADLLKKAKSNGYHTKVRKGQVYYCKEETKIGSHFSEDTCYDACGGGGGGSCGGK